MSTVTTTRIPQPRKPASTGAAERPALRASNIDPIRVLRRHIVGIALAAIGGAALGVVAFLLLNRFYPLYSGEVLFEVMPGLHKAGDIGTTDTVSNEWIQRVAQTETFLLTTPLILQKALDDTVIRTTKWHTQFIETDADGREVFNHNQAMDDLAKDVTTRVMRGSSLFSVGWSSPDRDDVPKVLNAVAGAYLRMREARDRDLYDKNLALFQDQASKTQRALEDLAENIQRLIRNARITTLDDVRFSAEAVKLQELMEQLAGVSASLNMTDTQFRLVQEQIAGTIEPSSANVLMAERDPQVLDQITRLQAMKEEHNRLLQTRPNPTDPQVQNIEARIRAAEETRDATMRQIIQRNLQAEARELAISREKLQGAVKQLDAEVESIHARMRDLAADQSKYEELKVRRDHLEKQRTADQQLINELQLMRVRADASRVREVQPAFEPRQRSFPKPQIIIPLGILLAVGLTVGIVFLRELVDQRVKSVSDLAILPGANVLGGIPDLDDDPTRTPAAELVVRKQPFSVIAESYRQVAATLMPLIDLNGHQALLLVGGLPGAGTTTAATNLAAAAAAGGRRVLLIDANFRRPRLAEAMGVSTNGPGLGDLLVKGASPDDAVIDAGEGVSVIHAGTPASRVFDRMNTGTFDSLLAELRGRFDLIIIDAPPAVVAGEAMMLANKVDAAVLVVRAHQEHRGLVARMIGRFAHTRCELLGVLLNRPRNVAGGYLKKNYATMAKYGESAAS